MPLLNVQDLIRVLQQEIAALSALDKQFKHDRTRDAETEKVKRQSRLLEIKAELAVLLESNKTEAEMPEIQVTQDIPAFFQ
jgi:hypothetical protein